MGLVLTERSAAQSNYYRHDNLTYDLSHVHTLAERQQILAALKLGYTSTNRGGKSIALEISHLRGNNQPRTIAFYSDDAEANPGAVAIGAPAFAIWNGPLGANEMISPPSERTDLRIFLRDDQPYWYLVNSVWHELLHLTLQITHHQTTPEGTVNEDYVNDAIWYSTIYSIMLNFPSRSVDPATKKPEELYNINDNPWS
jgi:hypothetical protein